MKSWEFKFEGNINFDHETFENLFGAHRDLRSRTRIKDGTGNNIKLKPTKKLEDCFDVQTVSWTITAFFRTTRMKLTRGLVTEYEEKEVTFSSGHNERLFRADAKDGGFIVL